MPTSLFLSLLDKRPIIIFRCYLKKYKCFYFLTCNTSVKTWNKIFPVDTQVINAIGFYIYPKEMFKCQKTLRSAPNLSPNRQNKIDLVISDLSLNVNHLNINLIPTDIKSIFKNLLSKERLYLSIKVPVCQWVSEYVCLFPNSFETANPSELKFWGIIPLGIGKVLG